MPAKKKTTSTAKGRPRRASARQPRSSARRSPPPPAPEPPESSPFTESRFTPGMSPDCMMCPFGLFFYTMRNTRPETMQHLTAAGHELFLAFRSLVEQAGERWEQSQSLQRITVR